MYSYVAFMEGNSSTTVATFENPDAGNWGVYYHRSCLQQAIDAGDVTEPGFYVVASPDGEMLNADLFEVDAITTPTFRIKESNA